MEEMAGKMEGQDPGQPLLAVEPQEDALSYDIERFTRKKRPVKKIILILLGLIVVAFIAMKLFGPKDLSIPVTTMPLQKQELSKTVSTTGTVESANSAQVYAKASGMVASVLVQVGDTVQAGDVLAQLDTEALELSIAQQRALLAQKGQLNAFDQQQAQQSYEEYASDLATDQNAELVSAEHSLDLAQRDLSDARRDMSDHKDEMDYGDSVMYGLEKELKRAKDAWDDARKALDADKENPDLVQAEEQAHQAYEKVYEEWLATDKEYGDTLSSYSKEYRRARLAYDNALENYRLAKLAAERTADSKAKELERNLIANDLTADQLALQQLQMQLEDSTVRSPISGTVTAVYAKEGAPAGSLLFVIEDTNDLLIKTTLKEYDIVAVEEGMPTVVKSDATGEMEYEGEVARVYPTAAKTADGQTKSSGSVEFETDVALLTGQDDLRVGMNVRLNVVVDQKKDVYAVPFDAVSTNENGESIVYLAKPDETGMLTAQPVVVQTGLETDFYIEISGEEIKDGAQVITGEQMGIGLIPGMPVRIQAGAAGGV